MEKVICLDGWRFDFPKRLLVRAAALLDSGMKPTEVAQEMMDGARLPTLSIGLKWIRIARGLKLNWRKKMLSAENRAKIIPTGLYAREIDKRTSTGASTHPY